MKTAPSDPNLAWIEGEIDHLKDQHLFRQLKTLNPVTATRAGLDGRELTLFCGNDYLGLSHHPAVKQAALEAIKQYGVGAGSARLIAGSHELHMKLEKKLAAFLNKERTLVFSSGYLTNLGVLSAVAGTGDTIVLDKLCHASLIDGARLSQAKVRVYPHKNLAYLKRVLEREHKHAKRKIGRAHV